MKAVVYHRYGSPGVLQLKDVKKPIPTDDEVLIHVRAASVKQIAKSVGAEVTGVDSTRKLDMLRSIGADHVIDYTQEDFTKNGQRYDLILDVVAYRSIFDYRRALNPGGIFVVVGGATGRIFQIVTLGSLISRVGDKKLGLLIHRPSKKDLESLKDLYETGKVTPVIDRHYPLSEVPAALRYFGEGHVQGKIVITV